MTAIIPIEWKHYDKEGNTCNRCADTGTAIRQAIREIAEDLKARDAVISLSETLLPASEIQTSNTVLINDIPLEDLLDNTATTETKCASCCSLIGSDVNCRALDRNGTVMEAIPVELIKRAVLKVLKKEEA